MYLDAYLAYPSKTFNVVTLLSNNLQNAKALVYIAKPQWCISLAGSFNSVPFAMGTASVNIYINTETLFLLFEEAGLDSEF